MSKDELSIILYSSLFCAVLYVKIYLNYFTATEIPSLALDL